jgi:phospho-N-acetylmuramoyl-pentapeptide-transferase
MLYQLLYPLHLRFGFFNLFRYITFRAAYAGITSLLICFFLGPSVIRWLMSHRFFAGVREKGLESQEIKSKTPTMGGILILLAVLVATLLWADLRQSFIHIVLFSTVSLGLLGFYDDFKKLRTMKGVRPLFKFTWQVLIGLVIVVYLLLSSLSSEYATKISLLFLKNTFLNLGIFYIPFVILVMVGSSNAVNLTDGLDGLACGLVAIAAASFAALAYVVGNIKFAHYLNVLFIIGSGELTVFLSSVAGAMLGFLWFNTHPAQVFMGDTGSLPMGGAVGVSAVLIKQEILLAIVGGVFVIEALSVILQVAYFKRTRKRLFRMAPLHHHFEKLGISETKIVVRFWIIGVLFGLLAISTLKIR